MVYLNEIESQRLSTLLAKVQSRLKALYFALLVHAGERYRRLRDKSELEIAEQIIPKLREYDPNNYQCKLSAAMAAFTLRRDIQSAKEEIAACGHEKESAWRYGEAFLFLYEGELENAYHSYKRAFRAPTDITVPNQSEEFIQIVLEEEPDRVWLYYGLGLINSRVKMDLGAARRDFKAFINSADPKCFHKHIAFAETWLSEIDEPLERSA